MLMMIIRRLVILTVVLLGASLLWYIIIIPKGVHCFPITISNFLLGVGIGMLYAAYLVRRDWRKSKVPLDKIPNNIR